MAIDTAKRLLTVERKLKKAQETVMELQKEREHLLDLLLCQGEFHSGSNTEMTKEIRE